MYIIVNYFSFSGFYGGKSGASNHFSDKSSLGLTYHRMVEAFKFGFGQRGNLADSSFVNVNNVRTIDQFFYIWRIQFEDGVTSK